MRRGPGGGLNNRQLRMLLPLALAVWQHVQRLDFVPYATLATLALNAYVFLHTAGHSVLPYCISAAKVLGRSSRRRQTARRHRRRRMPPPAPG